jgi:hypothetical protein
MGIVLCRRVLGIVLCGIAIVASACSNPFASDGPTRIRLRNASSFELTSVTFDPGSEALKFARIAPNETTEYTSVAHAYSYGYFDALVGGERRTLQPIDYVGERYIGEGKFTYVITIQPQTKYPLMQLIKD